MAPTYTHATLGNTILGYFAPDLYWWLMKSAGGNIIDALFVASPIAAGASAADTYSTILANKGVTWNVLNS